MRKIGLVLFLFFTVNFIFAGTESWFPVADAGPDRTVVKNTPVTLDGSGSYDPEGEEITYRWSAPEDIVLSDTTAIYPTFTAPVVDSVEAYTIILIVNDGQWDSDPDPVVITVVTINTPPVADAGEDQTVEKFSEVTLTGSGSYDTTSTGVLNYSWTAPLGIDLSDETIEKPTFIAPDIDITTDYMITLTVDDGDATSAQDTVVITVLGNSPPVSDPGVDQVVAGGAFVTLDGSDSYDPEGSELTYLWTVPPDINLSDETSISPTFTAPNVDVSTYFTFSLTVNDGLDDSEPYAFDIYISEYAETGSSNDRYIEIYNGTGYPVDLSTYEIWLIKNGGDWFEYNFSLNGILEVDSVLVVVKSSTGADDDITEHSHIEWSTLSNMSGDDAVGLAKNGILIDVIGEEGDDPGSGWKVAGVEDATKNHTLVRKHNIVQGNVDWESSAGEENAEDSEWIVYDRDTFTYAGSHNCTSCDEEVNITVTNNQPPVANSGIDQTVVQETVVTLDGSASYDSTYTGTLTYHWTAPEGITLSDSTEVYPTFTAPAVSVDTGYFFTLSVNDGLYYSTPDTVVITVVVNNQPPLALASFDSTFFEDKGYDTTFYEYGVESTFYENCVVTLVGENSYDPTSTGVINYSWIAPEGITLSDSTVANPIFVTPIYIGEDRQDTFRLVIDDGDLLSDTASVVISVEARYPIVTVVKFPDSTFFEDSLVTLDGSNSYDPNSGSLYYEWEDLSNTLSLSGGNTANPTITIPTSIGSDKDYTITLQVNDGELYSESDNVVVSVEARYPVAKPGKDQTITEGVEVILNGSRSEDPNATLISYGYWDTDVDLEDWKWKTGNRRVITYADSSVWKPYDEYSFYWTSLDGIVLSDSNALKPTFIAPDVSGDTDYTFTLTVDDGEFNSDEENVTITVIPYQSPIADAGEDRKIYKGDEYSLDASGSKLRIWTIISYDTTVVGSFSYRWTAPESIILSDTTSVSPTFIAPDVLEDTDYIFTLTVNDGRSDSEPDTVVITVSDNFFSPPIIPPLFTTVDHGVVMLTWDKTSENSIDSLTGYADFEGYKLYKSTDGGKTWGGPDDILYDYEGQPVGWKPIAQFDLDFEQDTSHCIYTNGYYCENSRGIGISGYDPLAPRFNLGDNTGLKYSFIDSNVVDGVEYTYSLTAYDIGLRTDTTDYEYHHTFLDTMPADTFIYHRLSYDIESSFVDTADNKEYYILNPLLGVTNGEKIYSEKFIWSKSNPDHFTHNGNPYKSLECSKGITPEDINFVTIIPGYHASNITFPNPRKADEFIVTNLGTIGTGDRFFTIINEDSLSDALIRFEIQADLGTSFENYAIDNPVLYTYEVDTIPVLNRPAAQIPVNWGDEFSFNVDTSDNPVTSLDSINILMDLPGADSSNFSQDSIIRLPDYRLEAFPIKYLDEKDYQNNWTDTFDGIRFRFDNMPKGAPQGEDFEEIQELVWKADSTVIRSVDIDLSYWQNYSGGLNFDYKIVFGTTGRDTVVKVSPGEGTCMDRPTKTVLPFKIINMTTRRQVALSHSDNGLDGDYDPASPDDGEDDCLWTRNEEIKFYGDTVRVGTEITEEKTFILNITYNLHDAFPDISYESWEIGQIYNAGEYVGHEGMLWKASEDIMEDIDPIEFIDENDDGINENPWQIQYPWKDGDYVIIKPKKFFVDGDSWIADLSLLGKPYDVTQEELEEIKVVPNPYFVHSRFETPQSLSHRLRFTHLPQQCRITIYTISGERVVTLDHNDEYDSNEWWDLRTGHGKVVAPGLYIYTVESEGLKHIGKFAVVR